MSKDYYRTLGVLDDAEDIVIKAAYKALAQRYHPDKWVGDKDEATRRMSDINEAYGVLSDPIKRKQYDSTRDKDSYQMETSKESDEQQQEINTSLDEDWKQAVSYFPDLATFAQRLRHLSVLLESAYKLYLVEKKEFTNRKEIALTFEYNYLNRFFGSNPEIVQYASNLLQAGQIRAAKALNEAVNILGSNIDPKVIIEKINADFNLSSYRESKKYAKRLVKKYIIERTNTHDAIDFVHSLGGEVQVTKRYFSSDEYQVSLDDINQSMNTREFMQYAKEIAEAYLLRIARKA
jgi:curved DNA-binding protein CbpA